MPDQRISQGHFIATDRGGGRKRHVVIKGRLVAGCVYIDEVVLTETPKQGRPTLEIPLALASGVPPRYVLA
jgi:hypothetical protein